MINPNDSIRFTNVVSSKYSFHYSEFKEVMQNFIESVVRCDASVNGPLFYSINNVPKDEMVSAEFFIPVEEDQINGTGGMKFHSYFCVEDMISICLYQNFQQQTEVAYALLLEYVAQNQLKQVTPIFHVITGDETLQYVYIKMGVGQKNLEELWK